MLPVLALLLLTASIIAVGKAFLDQQRAVAIRQATDQLQSITALKCGQISWWLDNRLRNAEVTGDGRAFGTMVERYLADQGNLRLREAVKHRLQIDTIYGQYSDIFLISPAGRMMLSEKPETLMLSKETRRLAEESMGSRRRIFSDFYWCPEHRENHLDIIAPLWNSGVTGALVFRIDPGRFLYPLLREWPVPSRTAETYIVRRDGDSVQFLSPLRHRPDAALGLRLPLADTTTLAVKAALGFQGTSRGRDYRGVPVLSAVSLIAGTQWRLIAKVDMEEVLAPYRKLAWVTITGLLFLLGAAGAAAGLAWQRRQKKHYRELSRLQEERLALSEHYKYLSKYSNDIVLLVREDSTIVEANDRALQAYGYSGEELIGKTTRELRIASEREKLEEQMRTARESGGALFETVQMRKDGAAFPVEVSLRPMGINGSTYYQGIIRDITERKRYEAELRKFNRELEAIKKCNQSLIRAVEEDRLLDQICRIVVEEGGYPFVWVGYAGQGPEKAVKPMAYNGREGGYLKSIKITWDESEHGRGPTGTAIRTGKTCLNRDTGSNPDYGPWRERALAHGFGSSLALPLAYGMAVYGALNVYADGPDAFSDAEIKLLEELAGDIGYGIAFLRNARARAKALKDLEERNAELIAANEELQASDEEIRASEEELRQQNEELVRKEEALRAEKVFSDRLLNAPADTVFVFEADTGKAVRWNSVFREVSGYGDQEIAGLKAPDSYYSPEDLARAAEATRSILATGKGALEMSLITKDGRKIPYEYNTSVVSDDAGAPKFLIAIGRDLTERMRAEEELRHYVQELERAQKSLIDAQARYAQLFSVMKNCVAVYKAVDDGGDFEFTDFNEAAQRAEKLPKGQVLGRRVTEVFPGIRQMGLLEVFQRVWKTGMAESYPVTMYQDQRLTGWRENYVYKLPSGEIVALYEDVTEIKRAELALQHSESRLRRFYESGMMGVIYWNMDGVITDANDKFLEMFGYTREELKKGEIDWVNMTPPEFRHLDEKSVVELKKTGVNAVPFEKEYVRKDGSRVPILIAGAMLDEARYDGVAFVLDITESKRAEERIKKQLAELRRWQTTMLEREDRVRELKEEVNHLLEKAGRPKKYGNE